MPAVHTEGSSPVPYAWIVRTKDGHVTTVRTAAALRGLSHRASRPEQGRRVIIRPRGAGGPQSRTSASALRRWVRAVSVAGDLLLFCGAVASSLFLGFHVLTMLAVVALGIRAATLAPGAVPSVPA